MLDARARYGISRIEITKVFCFWSHSNYIKWAISISSPTSPQVQVPVPVCTGSGTVGFSTSTTNIVELPRARSRATNEKRKRQWRISNFNFTTIAYSQVFLALLFFVLTTYFIGMIAKTWHYTQEDKIFLKWWQWKRRRALNFWPFGIYSQSSVRPTSK